jgi:hypothetical protein
MITTRLARAGCRLRNGALDEHPSSGQPTSGAVVAFFCRLKKPTALGSNLTSAGIASVLQDEPRPALHGHAFCTSHVIRSALCLATCHIWRSPALSSVSTAASPAAWVRSLCACAYFVRDLWVCQWSNIPTVWISARLYASRVSGSIAWSYTTW